MDCHYGYQQCPGRDRLRPFGAVFCHTYCTDIPWSEAQPGDLAFYPEDEHIGIVGGRDEDGKLLVIHCSSGSLNNVVITGASGFVAIATPQFYGEE